MQSIPSLCRTLQFGVLLPISFAFALFVVLRLCVVCSNQYVRMSVASVLPTLGPILGKAKTLEQLVPLFIKLLRDEVRHTDMNTRMHAHACTHAYTHAHTYTRMHALSLSLTSMPLASRARSRWL